MTKPTDSKLSELREVRELLENSSAMFQGLRSLRNVDGIADIDPDLPLDFSVEQHPELIPQLSEHFDRVGRWSNLEDLAQARLKIALARLDAVIRSIEGEA